MNERLQPARPGYGAGRLPGTWGVVVQLVGTFGLAVFLVLYYVLVMQPREQIRYEELRTSIDSMIRVVEEGQSLLTREQGDRLKELYILSVVPELASRIEDRMPGSPTPRPVSAADGELLKQLLCRDLADVLLVRSQLLRGLSRRDGGDVAELIRNTVRENQSAEKLAARVIIEWPYRSREEMLNSCRESLRASLQTLAPPR